MRGKKEFKHGGWRKKLCDFVTPGVQGIASSIARPAVDANNFELKLALISILQQSQFGGTPLEDLNLHLSVFLEVCDKLKLNGVSSDAILCLFPFSLRGKARTWLPSLPSGCITTWDELARAPSKIASLRNQVTHFLQKEDETLYEACERFKDLLHLCSHHGLQRWMIIHAFYNGVT